MSKDAYDPMADIAQVLFSAAAIQKRVEALGAAIARDYLPRRQADPHWSLLLVSVLRGGIFFLTDLARAIALPTTVDFMALTQYGTPGQGRVRILKDLEDDIADRDVLVVEDIIDTGLSLGYLLGVLQARRPRSIQVATLLDRPSLRIVEHLPVRYTGFSIDDVFVVGYGLDYRQRYRDLPFIGVLKEQLFDERGTQ